MTLANFLKIYIPLSSFAFSVLITGILVFVAFPPLGCLILLLWMSMISSCSSFMVKSGYTAVAG
jgi:heme/copper-type cytochrome/quinol oxidase subunit 1